MGFDGFSDACRKLVHVHSVNFKFFRSDCLISYFSARFLPIDSVITLPTGRPSAFYHWRSSLSMNKK